MAKQPELYRENAELPPSYTCEVSKPEGTKTHSITAKKQKAVR